MFKLTAPDVIAQCRASMEAWKTKYTSTIVAYKDKIQYNNSQGLDWLWHINAGFYGDVPHVLITAGFHGNEVAGPLTLALHMHELFSFARRLGANLFILPLCNPWGWSNNKHYSCDRGQFGNNDFVRYRLKGGEVAGDLTGLEDWLEYAEHWSADSDPLVPGETKAIQRLLQERLAAGYRFAAAIDLHQDHETSKYPGAYHYAFGDLRRYEDIVKAVRRLVPIISKVSVAAGQSSPMETDDNGFIVRHDGSITDLMHRLQMPHTVCVETTAATPLELAIKVNLAWIKGVIALVGKENKAEQKEYWKSQ